MFINIANDITPSPLAYGLQPHFKPGHSQHAYTFGLSREAFQNAYLRENPPRDKVVPGPGTYPLKPQLGTEGAKWTMRVKPGRVCL